MARPSEHRQPTTKSAQDSLGRALAAWRNRRIAREIEPPFLDVACGDNRLVRSLPGGIGVDVVDYGNGAEIVKRLDKLPFVDGRAELLTMLDGLPLFLSAHRRFMLGLNHLYRLERRP